MLVVGAAGSGAVGAFSCDFPNIKCVSMTVLEDWDLILKVNQMESGSSLKRP